jgi:molybdopterin converting factor small subunit
MSTERACVVNVDYIGVIHHVLESTEEQYSLSLGSTIKDLLQRLVERHGEEFAGCILRSDGQLLSTVKVFLNSKDISRLQGLDTPITGETEISVLVGLIPIQGG